MKKERNQINFAVDAELRAALDDIRAMRRPVPTLSEAIRQAIFNERDMLKRKLARANTEQLDLIEMTNGHARN